MRAWLRPLVIAAAALVLAACVGAAHAARNFSYTQSPATGTKLPMGTVQALTFTVNNTSTGTTDRIYEVRFRLASGSTFASSTVAPAGWTRTAYSTTSVTFQATSWATAIAPGGSLAFTINVLMLTGSADTADRLRDIRSRFTDSTTGPPFNRTGTITFSNAGSWTVTSLQITSFVITDTLGNPITSLSAGQSFRLVMTVKNVSNTTQTGIVSNPNPPTAVKTGTVTQSLTGTAGSPLSLAAGASGTITFTYSTGASDSGTIYFTADARRSGTVTSPLATSTTLAVSVFVAGLAVAPSCQYDGSTITVTMTLTDGYAYNILNVTTTLTPAVGAPITYVSGPVPANPIASVPASPPSTTVTWVYRMNNTGTTNPFTFSGSATGTGNTGGSPTRTTPTAISAQVTRGAFPTTINPTVVNAGSGNVELVVSVANNGCAAINSVAITAPAGWTAAGDNYSLVNLSGGASTEAWTASGANPVVFTAPNLASQMPLTFDGDFAVVYSATPPAATTSTFTVRVTDANGLYDDIPLTVTVNAFKSGTLNDAATRVWREDFR